MVEATRRPLEPVWLVCQARVLASATRATSRSDRRRGLLGLDRIEEPLLLDPCSWVHSLGMKFPIEVGYLAGDGELLRIERLDPWRVGPVCRRARVVIEAAPGSFERWNVGRGDLIEVRGPDDR